MNIMIDPEFKALTPELTDAEYVQLEKNIIAEKGARDELIVWGSILLDGHNRLKICREHNLPYMTRFMDFPDRDAAKHWIICNQLGRRNITPERRKYLIGKQYELEKQEHGGQIPKGMGQNEPSLSTAAKIAEQHHVSPSSVKRAAKFAETVDKLPSEKRSEVFSGKSPKPKKATTKSARSTKREIPPTPECIDALFRNTMNAIERNWKMASFSTKDWFLTKVNDLTVPYTHLYRKYFHRERLEESGARPPKENVVDAGLVFG